MGMAYRMKMFKSQKPSSFDLRVSDFKRIPGFNYVLSVSTEDEHTYNSLAQGKRENIWRSMPNLARGSARSENSSGEQFGVASRAITPWIRDGSLIAAHNMLWAAMPREP